jgi:hypothetical protein
VQRKNSKKRMSEMLPYGRDSWAGKVPAGNAGISEYF